MWNEAFASGKPFPEKKVPIEVWSLGRFKFKGIAGTCKVSTLLLYRVSAASCLTHLICMPRSVVQLTLGSAS